MAVCPFSIWRPVSAHGGAMDGQVLGVVIHVTAGEGDPFNEFANPANQVSSHFGIGNGQGGMPDGTLEQYVDTDNASWAQAAGNYSYISVETEGEPTDPLTTNQVQTFARLLAWLYQQDNFSLVVTDGVGTEGLITHGDGGQAWGGHQGCPGPARSAQRAAIVFLADLSLNPPASYGSIQEDDMPVIYPPNAGEPGLASEVAIATPPGKSGTVWLACDFQPQTVRCFVGVAGAMRPYGSTGGIVGVPVGRKIGIPFAATDEMVSLVHGGPNIPKGQPHPVSTLMVTN